MLSELYAIAHLSVRQSDGCIIEKRLKLGLWNFHHTVTPYL